MPPRAARQRDTAVLRWLRCHDSRFVPTSSVQSTTRSPPKARRSGSAHAVTSSAGSHAGCHVMKSVVRIGTVPQPRQSSAASHWISSTAVGCNRWVAVWRLTSRFA